MNEYTIPLEIDEGYLVTVLALAYNRGCFPSRVIEDLFRDALLGAYENENWNGGAAQYRQAAETFIRELDQAFDRVGCLRTDLRRRVQDFKQTRQNGESAES